MDFQDQKYSGYNLAEWMPAVLSLFGTLIVVVLTAWLNTRAVSAQIDGVRAEIKALEERIGRQLTELELRLSKQIMELRRCHVIAVAFSSRTPSPPRPSPPRGRGENGFGITTLSPLGSLGGEGGAQAPGEGGRWQPLEMLFRNEPLASASSDWKKPVVWSGRRRNPSLGPRK